MRHLRWTLKPIFFSPFMMRILYNSDWHWLNSFTMYFIVPVFTLFCKFSNYLYCSMIYKIRRLYVFIMKKKTNSLHFLGNCVKAAISLLNPLRWPVRSNNDYVIWFSVDSASTIVLRSDALNWVIATIRRVSLRSAVLSSLVDSMIVGNGWLFASLWSIAFPIHVFLSVCLASIW